MSTFKAPNYFFGQGDALLKYWPFHEKIHRFETKKKAKEMDDFSKIFFFK